MIKIRYVLNGYIYTYKLRMKILARFKNNKVTFTLNL